MIRSLILTTALLLSACGIPDSPSSDISGEENQTLIALINVTVIDGTGAEPVPAQTVLIADGRIHEVGPAGQVTVPDTALVIDAAGKFVIPGLIDTHVHLATDPSGVDNREAVESMLALALDRGIVSVRDMAGDARALADLKRDALVFDIHSPDIYYTALMSGPAFFTDPRTHSASAGLAAGETPWLRAVTEDTDLLYAIAEAKGTGATGIKIYASLGPAEIDRITAEAHQQNMEVWSHGVIDPAGPRDAVASGVDVLSHISHLRWAAEDSVFSNTDSTFWSLPVSDHRITEFLDSVLKAGTMLDPTLLLYKIDPDRPMTASKHDWVINVTRAAYQAGIVISTGTDTDGEIATLDEIFLMVNEVGMSPLDALTAATLNGAKVIGIENETGSITVGKYADLVLLHEDPTVDISNLQSLFMVIKKGRIVVK